VFPADAVCAAWGIHSRLAAFNQEGQIDSRKGGIAWFDTTAGPVATQRWDGWILLVARRSSAKSRNDPVFVLGFEVRFAPIGVRSLRRYAVWIAPQ